MAVKIVDPLDVIEGNFRCVRKLALPLTAGEALKPAIFRWHESPFHYSPLRHITPPRRLGHSLTSSTIMFCRNSSRSRRGHRSSSGFGKEDSSARLLGGYRG